MSLCRFKDMFGKPGEGIHSYRIGNFAAFDILATVGLGKGISDYADVGILTGMAIAFGSGVIAHNLFCVKTQLTPEL